MEMRMRAHFAALSGAVLAACVMSASPAGAQVQAAIGTNRALSRAKTACRPQRRNHCPARRFALLERVTLL